MKILTSVFGIIGLFLMNSCDNQDFTERPVHELYNMALDLMLKKDYGDAAKTFEETDRQHPSAKESTKAQVMAAYCYFMNANYDNARATISTFLQDHPNHPEYDAYMLYLGTLCNYALLRKYDRDQSESPGALNSFQNLQKKYPNSAYAKDMNKKIAFVKGIMKEKEYSLGMYNYDRKYYLAASKRFMRVIDEYPDSDRDEECMFLTIVCYRELLVKSLADDMYSKMKKKYPKSKWIIEYDQKYKG
jgi:outer membrane protein assembly factor BamD